MNLDLADFGFTTNKMPGPEKLPDPVSWFLVALVVFFVWYFLNYYRG